MDDAQRQCLQQQIYELTQKNTNLEQRVTAAEGNEKAAIKRASVRHTERLHANRRAERAEQDLSKAQWNLKDNDAKAERVARCANEVIDNLKKEQAAALSVIVDLQNDADALHAEIARLKNSVAEQVKEAAEKSDHSTLINDLKRQASEALQVHKAQFESSCKQKMAQAMPELQQKYHVETQKTAALENQLLNATREIEWYKKKLQPQQTSVPSSSSPTRKHAGTPIAPQQEDISVDIASKRWRLDNAGNFGMTTPDRHRLQSQAQTQPPNDDFEITNSNELFHGTTAGAQRSSPRMQQQAQYRMPSGVLHQQQSPRQPNLSDATRMAPASDYNAAIQQKNPSSPQHRSSEKKVREAAVHQQVMQRQTRRPTFSSSSTQQESQKSTMQTECQGNPQYLSQPPLTTQQQTMFTPDLVASSSIADGDSHTNGAHMTHAASMDHMSAGKSSQYKDRVNSARQTSGTQQMRSKASSSQSMPPPPMGSNASMPRTAVGSTNQTYRSSPLASSFVNGTASNNMHQHGGGFIDTSLLQDGARIHQHQKQHLGNGEVANNMSRNEDAGAYNRNHAVNRLSPMSHEPAVSTSSASVPQKALTQTTQWKRAPRNVACISCHKNWWEESCQGRPCTNCQEYGVDCMREKCASFAAGTCAKRNKCKGVHEDDAEYNDEQYLITSEKPSKRKGKKADAMPAPSTLNK